MQRLLIGTAAIAGLVLAAGCGGDGDGSRDGNLMQPLGNSFAAIVNQDPNDEPIPINDPAALRQDLNAIFGGPNDDPLVIGDRSLSDIANNP